MGAGDSYDIFISYTHEDADAARRLATELTARGWSVFWDRVLLPGATWRTQIQSALSGSKVVLVMWSPRAANSRWVEVEADHAFERDAYIPVQIESTALPLGLSQVQVADLRDWHADPRHPVPDLLLSALSHRLGSSSPPIHAPAPVAAFGDGEVTVVAGDAAFRFSGSAHGGGETYELLVRLSQLRMKPEGLVIGRQSDHADLVVPHPSVSRRHALLVSLDGRLAVSDLGSTNGTFVNDRPALRDHPLDLVRGAVVRIGDVDFIVEGALH
jgi:hypothetical protein